MQLLLNSLSEDEMCQITLNDESKKQMHILSSDSPSKHSGLLRTPKLKHIDSSHVLSSYANVKMQTNNT